MSNLQDKAYDLSKKFHEGQYRRHSKLPYIVHPVAVVNLLKEWGVRSDVVLASAFAHDLLEDTKVGESTISSVLGSRVLKIVKELTNPDGVAKPDIIKNIATGASVRANLIKLADRISNTRDFISSGRRDKAKQYLKAAEPLVKRLRSSSGVLGGRVVRNVLNSWKKLDEELSKIDASEIGNKEIAAEIVLISSLLENKMGKSVVAKVREILE